MKVYVLTEDKSDVVGVYANLDDAKYQVRGGHWDYTGTRNAVPFGWFNGNFRVEEYNLQEGDK